MLPARSPSNPALHSAQHLGLPRGWPYLFKQDEATACRSGHLISPVSGKIIILELDCLLYSPRSHFQWQGEKVFDPLSAFVKDSLLASNCLSKTNTQQFRLEGMFGGHLVQSPAQSSSK